MSRHMTQYILNPAYLLPKPNEYIDLEMNFLTRVFSCADPARIAAREQRKCSRRCSRAIRGKEEELRRRRNRREGDQGGIVGLINNPVVVFSLLIIFRERKKKRRGCRSMEFCRRGGYQIGMPFISPRAPSHLHLFVISSLSLLSSPLTQPHHNTTTTPPPPARKGKRSMFFPRRKLKRLLIMLLPFLLTLTLLTPLFLIYKPPPLLIRYFQHRWPDTLWHVPLPASLSSSSGTKLIALTIDDAPSSHTADIANALRENNAHATFFLIGAQIPSREQTLHALIRGGHELANHAMHDEPSRSLEDDELARQLSQVQDQIRAAYAVVREADADIHNDNGNSNSGSGQTITEPRERYFRPGSGFFSDRMRALVRNLGYRIVMGSVYPHDAQVKWPWVNARHVLSMVRPGGVIICHDRRGWTAPMLRVVLPELRRRGYEVVTVSELLRRAELGR